MVQNKRKPGKGLILLTLVAVVAASGLKGTKTGDRLNAIGQTAGRVITGMVGWAVAEPLGPFLWNTATMFGNRVYRLVMPSKALPKD